jgi:hypothetical protein
MKPTFLKNVGTFLKNDVRSKTNVDYKNVATFCKNVDEKILEILKKKCWNIFEKCWNIFEKCWNIFEKCWNIFHLIVMKY